MNPNWINQEIQLQEIKLIKLLAISEGRWCLYRLNRYQYDE